MAKEINLLSPQLQAFLAVVKMQTVHGAARELGITQTAATQRIRNLENSLSTTLFIRSRKGMQLTTEGQPLLRYCQAVRDLEGETLAKINGAGKQSEVRLSIVGPASLMRSRIVPQCLPLLRKWPQALISFIIDDHEHRDEFLRAGQVQLAILPHEQVAKEMDSKVLMAEKYVLVGCKKWAKRDLDEIIRQERIIDFEVADIMTFSYLKKFRLLHRARKERHFVNNTESLVEMIQQGIGYGVLTKEFAQPYLKKDQIVLLNTEDFFENPLVLAWYPRSHMPEHLAAFIKAIQ